MCNTMKLKGRMTERGIRQEDLAKAVGMDRSTLSRRLKTGEDFTIGETNKIVAFLNLNAEEALEIFLPTLSQKCD